MYKGVNSHIIQKHTIITALHGLSCQQCIFYGCKPKTKLQTRTSVVLGLFDAGDMGFDVAGHLRLPTVNLTNDTVPGQASWLGTRKTGLSPPVFLYWPFQGGTSDVVPYCYLFLLSVFILWFSYYVSDIILQILGTWMTTCLGKRCSFCLPRVPFVNCRQFMYLVISLLVLKAGCGIWLYQFLIIAYLFTFLSG